MIEVGRLCVKIAGRDAGKNCVIVDVLEKNFVLIDGETRRRKCNVAHIEPLEAKIDIKKGASHEDVVAEFKKIGLTAVTTKPKKKAPRQKKIRIGKPAAKTEEKTVEKKQVKKTVEKKTAK